MNKKQFKKIELNIRNRAMITIKHLQMYPALNNP